MTFPTPLVWLLAAWLSVLLTSVLPDEADPAVLEAVLRAEVPVLLEAELLVADVEEDWVVPRWPLLCDWVPALFLSEEALEAEEAELLPEELLLCVLPAVEEELREDEVLELLPAEEADRWVAVAEVLLEVDEPVLVFWLPLPFAGVEFLEDEEPERWTPDVVALLEDEELRCVVDAVLLFAELPEDLVCELEDLVCEPDERVCELEERVCEFVELDLEEVLLVCESKSAENAVAAIATADAARNLIK